MSSVETSSEPAASTPPVKAGEFKLEVVVADVDREKAFYASLGWRLDADMAGGEDFRIVQFTPPGSGCSIQFGRNTASAPPGSAESLYLIVADIDAARDELLALGMEVSELFHEGFRARASTTPGACPGRRPTAAPTGASRPSAIRMARYALYMVRERAGEELPT